MKIVAGFNKTHEALYEQLEKNTADITAQTTKVEGVLVKFEEVLQDNQRFNKEAIVGGYDKQPGTVLSWHLKSPRESGAGTGA